ncbi:universal stress protein [Streptomyces sp. NBC_00669]|uniref:universal stress protein n=1 Tax=Streptomyces sp. NBC_00669 TaxID=2976011 RepID=UPI002E36EE29|nr:universal stress protein [Streptomyces sp. NBC_00669]
MSQGGRVLVGLSGSLHSLCALHRAVEEARRREGELVAVTAWAPPGGELAYRRTPWPPLLAAGEKAAARCLERAFTDAFGGYPEDLDLSLVTARGEPGTALTELADRPDDLLVISTGRRGRTRLFHGGVRRYCLAHARCDILAVPPPDLMREVGHAARVLDELPLPAAGTARADARLVRHPRRWVAAAARCGGWRGARRPEPPEPGRARTG